MRLFVVALVFALMALPVFALTVKWVEYSPESQRIVAQVFNNSSEPVENFNAVFFVDGKETGSFGREDLSVPPRGTMTVFIDFPFDGKEHEFSVKILGEDSGPESEPLAKGFEPKKPADNGILTTFDSTVFFVAASAVVIGLAVIGFWLFMKKNIFGRGS